MTDRPAWFSNFFENAFVSRLKRRLCIRIVRLARSEKDVLTCAMSAALVIPRFFRANAICRPVAVLSALR
jgi:hypothetical protein